MIMVQPDTSIDFWSKHCEQWEFSGLTRTEYCAQQQINYNHFIYQRKKLSLKKRNKIKFLEVNTPAIQQNSSTSIGIQLILPNGIKIGIANEVNNLFLQTVLTVAVGVVC